MKLIPKDLSFYPEDLIISLFNQNEIIEEFQ